MPETLTYSSPSQPLTSTLAQGEGSVNRTPSRFGSGFDVVGLHRPEKDRGVILKRTAASFPSYASMDGEGLIARAT